MFYVCAHCASYFFLLILTSLHWISFLFYALQSPTTNPFFFFSILLVILSLALPDNALCCFISPPSLRPSHDSHPSPQPHSYMKISLQRMEHCRNSLSFSSENSDQEIERNGNVSLSLHDGYTIRYAVIYSVFF